MSELIDALLKMSRVSRAELKIAPVDVSAIAAEAAADLRNGDPGRSVAFAIEPGLVLKGDPALLRNLMDNLLGNAWKFTGGVADARIEVGRNAQGEFFVRDNGAASEPEYADKLFRLFQRLHSQEQYAGHGIGLASVRRIVERHGGSVRAEAGGRGWGRRSLPPPARADRAVGRCPQAGSGAASRILACGPLRPPCRADHASRLWRRMTRCFSRSQSRCLLVSRLSCACLPLARASSAFTLLPFQYRAMGTTV